MLDHQQDGQDFPDTGAAAPAIASAAANEAAFVGPLVAVAGWLWRGRGVAHCLHRRSTGCRALYNHGKHRWLTWKGKQGVHTIFCVDTDICIRPI